MDWRILIGYSVTRWQGQPIYCSCTSGGPIVTRNLTRDRCCSSTYCRDGVDALYDRGETTLDYSTRTAEHGAFRSCGTNRDGTSTFRGDDTGSDADGGDNRPNYADDP